MGLGISEIQEWNVATLDTFAAELNSRESLLCDVESTLNAASNSLDWSGIAHDAATRYIDTAGTSVLELAAAAGALATLVTDLATSGKAIKATLDGLLKSAQEQGFMVTENGTVVDVTPISIGVGVTAAMAAAVAVLREGVRKTLEAEIKLVISRAEDAEDDASRIMNSVANGEVTVPPAPDVASAFDSGTHFADHEFEADLKDLPATATPGQVKTFWDTLSEKDRKEAIEQDPVRIAKLDGVPAADMDSAGQKAMDKTETDLKGRKSELETLLSDPNSGVNVDDANKELHSVNQKLDGINIIRRELNEKPYDPSSPLDGRLLLSFDATGERLKFGIANGNPDVADHVATFVPGLNSNVYSFGRNATDVGMADEALDVKNETVRLLRSDPSSGDPSSVSTIAWLGYDTPVTNDTPNFGAKVQGAHDVAALDKARAGGAKLDLFLQGREVNAVNPNQHTTVAAHSYGSTTAAYGLMGKASVDDLVVYGSPGLDTQDSAALHVTGGKYYMAAPASDSGFGALFDDPVTYASERDELWGLLHGGFVNGTSDDRISSPDELGFTRLGTKAATVDDGTPGGSHRDGAVGHSEYGRRGDNGQLRVTGFNMATVIAGLPERTTR